MAFTNTRLIRNIEGAKIVEYWDVTADANSGSVVTGLSVVEAAVFSAVSATTCIQKMKINLSAASATANGSILMSSCLSGDHFILIAVGH